MRIIDNFELMEKNPSTGKKWGGARPNSGRPVGKLLPKTLDRLKVERELKQKIMNSAGRLYRAQMGLAVGSQMLYKIVEGKKKPQLVKEHKEIEAFLAGEYEDSPDEFYFLTTEKPENKAIDSLMDRTFGKAVQRTELSGANGEPLEITLNTKETKAVEDALSDL